METNGTYKNTRAHKRLKGLKGNMENTLDAGKRIRQYF